MQLTQQHLAQLIALAKNDVPNETCGIIAGKDGRALKVFALPNNAPSPLTEYNAEPHALLEAFREIESRRWEHLAIYHSHPASPAYPSPTDIARAFYPDALYLIISLMNPEQTSVRAFRIAHGKVDEVTLEVEDDEPSTANSRRPAGRASRSNPRRAVAALSRRRPASGNARRPRR